MTKEPSKLTPDRFTIGFQGAQERPFVEAWLSTLGETRAGDKGSPTIADARGWRRRGRLDASPFETSEVLIVPLPPEYEQYAPPELIQERQVQLLRAPGMRLRDWLSILFHENTLSRVLDPVLADLQYEWREAHQTGDMSLVRRVQIRGVWSLVCAILMRIPFSVVRAVWEVWNKLRLG